MNEEDYKQIRQKLQECFEKQEVNQGLKIAIEIKEKFPDHASAAYYNLAYFQALLNLTEDTVKTLEEGYEKGLWWAESIICMLPNYEELIKNHNFANIVKKYFYRYKKVKEATPFKWEVCIPENYDSNREYPVLFALHQGDSNIEETKRVWKSVLKHDMLLALPQSSEITEPNKFTWLNIDSGLKELNEIYNQIISTYSIDLKNIFLAGSSIGGTLAIEATLIRPKFPVKGFVVVNPALIKPDVIATNLEKAKKKNIRCSIVVGTKDPEYKQIKELATILNHEEIKNKYYEITDLGHTFPDNFDLLLEEIIIFFHTKSFYNKTNNSFTTQTWE